MEISIPPVLECLDIALASVMANVSEQDEKQFGKQGRLEKSLARHFRATCPTLAQAFISQTVDYDGEGSGYWWQHYSDKVTRADRLYHLSFWIEEQEDSGRYI